MKDLKIPWHICSALHFKTNPKGQGYTWAPCLNAHICVRALTLLILADDFVQFDLHFCIVTYILIACTRK